jgi:hypothetical protein
MPRSGSTFSFNIAKDALVGTGSIRHEFTSDVIEAIKSGDKYDCLLIKNHHMDNANLQLAIELGAKTICTIRKPEDAVASIIECFQQTEEEAIQSIKCWEDSYRTMKQYCLTIDYQIIDQNPLYATKEIMQYIEPNSSYSRMLESSEKYSKANILKQYNDLDRSNIDTIDIGCSWYNKGTFFHRKHVSSIKSKSAVERLSKDQLIKVRNSLASNVGSENNYLSNIQTH